MSTAAAGRMSAGAIRSIGALQASHGLLRPVCFYSAYEAATSFVIGQRISMAQTRRIKERLAEEAGDRIDIEVDGVHDLRGGLSPAAGSSSRSATSRAWRG